MDYSSMEEVFYALRRYNYWYGELPEAGYARINYLERFTRYIGNSLVKVLVGQRRSGKSFLLRQIASHLIRLGVSPKNIFYLNKEFIEFDDVADYKSLDELIKMYKLQVKPRGKIYLFIDEIQNIFQWEKLVNSYSQNYVDSYELFISGSNSKMLSGELSTLLAGRYVNFEIFPFSYDEFLGICNLQRGKSSFMDYLQSGGLPELFSLPDNEARRHYVSAVKDTILLRDIVQRHAIKEPKLLEDIFIYLINTSSNLMSINNITNYFRSRGRKTSFDTVANYIGYIEDVFLVHKAERYDIRGKDIILGNVKYYCNDLSYKNYLFSGFAHGVGYQLENLVFLELRRQGYEVHVGILPGKEVDFVARKAERLVYIQCAYLLPEESTLKREYASLEAIEDHYEKVLVSLDDVQFPIKDGIKHIQAWNLDSFL